MQTAEILDYLLTHLRIPLSEQKGYKLSYKVSPHPEALETDLHLTEMPLVVILKRLKAHANLYGHAQSHYMASWPRLYLVDVNDFKGTR